MNELVSKLSNLSPAELTYEHVGEILRETDLLSLDYSEYLQRVETSENYIRIPVLTDPIEVTLLVWPGNAVSAIHHHEGFWGYVGVLEGCCDNTEFHLEESQLIEHRTIRAFKGGLLAEPDGVIHELKNPNSNQTTVTMHVYYPHLSSFEGMKIFEKESGRIGVLGAGAKSASWNQSDDAFDSIQTDAFEFVPYMKHKPHSTHRIMPVVPKPDKERIEQMLSSYYAEQAESYDYFDTKHPSRSAYNERINIMIAKDLQELSGVHKVLTLACGTGRRALEIRNHAALDYKLMGVDLSAEMVQKAQSRGIRAISGSWNDIALPQDGLYDAATFLYAFGHVADSDERKKALSKINSYLRKGGRLYFDVFNVNDALEWGASAVNTYDELSLGKSRYEKGDVFYQKAGGESIAFLHYFSEEEIEQLLHSTGFNVLDIRHVGYVKKAGEILDDTEGTLFVIAEKTRDLND